MVSTDDAYRMAVLGTHGDAETARLLVAEHPQEDSEELWRAYYGDVVRE